MPNQNNSQKPQATQPVAPVKQYDAGDLWDAHSLAECDLNWCDTAISDLKSKFIEHKKYMMQAYGAHEAHFEQIGTMLDMYEYLIDNRLCYHKKEAQTYREEYEKDKAVTL